MKQLKMFSMVDYAKDVTMKKSFMINTDRLSIARPVSLSHDYY